MIIEQTHWTKKDGWQAIGPDRRMSAATLVLAFGDRDALTEPARFDEIRARYPGAHIVCGSTSGEIVGTAVHDESIAVTAITFDTTRIVVAGIDIGTYEESFRAGASLIGSLPQEGLVHVLVISDGGRVNGSELVRGMTSALPASVSVTGGLAGDGTRFQRTVVGLDAPPGEGKIVAVGFYGSRLKVGYGSMGGWDSFGPDRVITRAERNVLYELDGQSALSLYKKYLGELASALPKSAMLFPISIKGPDGGTSVVRTILSVDEEDESMTFAGDMPVGAYARLMKANFDRLIDGASIAASETQQMAGVDQPDLALLISCVGRKIVLSQRTEEEVECVREVMGERTVLAGFYSYGEISPFSASTQCELHNQTMTITTFSER